MKPITIKTITLHPVELPLKSPFRTSYGTQTHKHAAIIAVHTTDGVIGWGEASFEQFPAYDAETMTTGLHVLRDFLMPMMTGQTLTEPTNSPALVAAVRGHRFAKAGLEAAIWDAFAKTNHMRLVDLLARYAGDTPRDAIPVGAAVSLQSTIEETLALIQRRVEQGYTRIKLKIKPGQDVDLLAAVRGRFPAVPLMADANSAYTLADSDTLAQLDRYELMMIEQPLAYDDLYEHHLLSQRINTPICLDESVKSARDWRLALHIGAGHVLNLKPGRVGGFTEALAIYRLAVDYQADLWIGGMLETGIGRAAALALAALPGVTLPGDISASDRYFTQDIVEPAFTLGADGLMHLPIGDGIGVSVMVERLK
jgi:o-succinylbenzoate synthase